MIVISLKHRQFKFIEMNKIEKGVKIRVNRKKYSNSKILNKENVFLEDFKISCYTSVS
jgi:hypothetical protein